MSESLRAEKLSHGSGCRVDSRTSITGRRRPGCCGSRDAPSLFEAAALKDLSVRLLPSGAAAGASRVVPRRQLGAASSRSAEGSDCWSSSPSAAMRDILLPRER